MTLDDLMEKMNYNLKARGKSGVSILHEIQRDIIGLFSNSNDITQKMAGDFEAYLITSPEVMNEPEMYQGLNTFKNELKQIKENGMFKVSEVGLTVDTPAVINIDEEVISQGRSR